jgi:hypothetical protein
VALRWWWIMVKTEQYTHAGAAAAPFEARAVVRLAHFQKFDGDIVHFFF